MDDCNGFDRDLARLMEDSVGPAERRRLVSALRMHGAGCGRCGASLDLVEVLALPAEDRGAIEGLSGDYWSLFNERVRSRIASSESEASRPARGLWWAGAAAAVVLLSLASWLAMRQLAVHDPGTAGVPVAPDLPAELVDSLNEASPAEIAAQLAALSGWSPSGSAGVPGEVPGAEAPEDWGSRLFPEIDDLSAEERRELMSWLRSQPS